MHKGINSDRDFSLIINNIFGTYFEVEENKKLNHVTADFVATSFDKQGRTLAFSNKVIDYYYSYENAYIFEEKLESATFKARIDEITRNIIPTLEIHDHHYKSTVNLIFLSSLDEDLKKMICKYQKTQLFRFGLWGHLTVHVMAIDLEAEEVVGHTSTSKLINSFRKGLFRHE